jgi:RNA polymerase sigma-70 factor (ECF subfamily)
MVEESKIQELVTESKNGNNEAFGQIYDNLSKPVFNFLFARIRHKQQAEDLLQTVFLKVWHNLGTYTPTPRAKFSTWVFQIANYTLIDHWRTRKETTDISAVENLLNFAEDPVLYEKYDYLWQAVSKLPDEYQTVLDLRFRRDLNVAEAAQIMNKSQVGVRVLQHRAIKALRNLLSKNKNI